MQTAAVSIAGNAGKDPVFSRIDAPLHSAVRSCGHEPHKKHLIQDKAALHGEAGQNGGQGCGCDPAADAPVVLRRPSRILPLPSAEASLKEEIQNGKKQQGNQASRAEGKRRSAGPEGLLIIRLEQKRPHLFPVAAETGYKRKHQKEACKLLRKPGKRRGDHASHSLKISSQSARKGSDQDTGRHAADDERRLLRPEQAARKDAGGERHGGASRDPEDQRAKNGRIPDPPRIPILPLRTSRRRHLRHHRLRGMAAEQEEKQKGIIGHAEVGVAVIPYPVRQRNPFINGQRARQKGERGYQAAFPVSGSSCLIHRRSFQSVISLVIRSPSRMRSCFSSMTAASCGSMWSYPHRCSMLCATRKANSLFWLWP